MTVQIEGAVDDEEERAFVHKAIDEAWITFVLSNFRWTMRDFVVQALEDMEAYERQAEEAKGGRRKRNSKKGPSTDPGAAAAGEEAAGGDASDDSDLMLIADG